MTKIEDSYEYHAEQAKQSFQSSINGLLEAHSDFLHKISLATGNKKTGIWIEMSEAEILAGHIFEVVSNLMASYTIINNTNRLLNGTNRAYQNFLKDDLRRSVYDFRQGSISKDQFTERINAFVNVRKPNIAA